MLFQTSWWGTFTIAPAALSARHA